MQINRFIDSRPYYILCSIVFGIFFNMVAMFNIINNMASDFGLDYASISRLLSYYQFVYGFSALFAGYLNIKFSTRFLLLFANFFFSLLNITIFFLKDINQIIIARTICGFFASLIIPTSLIFINRNQEKSGKKMGLVYAFVSVGSISGVLISGLLGWKFSFLLPGMISFINFLLILFFFPSRTPGKRQKQTKAYHFIKEFLFIFTEFKNTAVLSLLFLHNFIMSSIYSYSSFYLSEYFKIAKPVIAVVLMTSSVGMVLGSFTGGILLDKFKRHIIYLSGLIVLSFAIIFFKINPFVLLTFPVFLLLGFSNSLTHLSLVNSIFTINSKEKSVYIASLNSFIIFLANSTGVMFYALINSQLNYRNYLSITIIFNLSLFLCVLFFAAVIKMKNKNKTSIN
ncbi:MAG: MFS transporter [Spirochaetes bacterium]|nr:MFS transporter [Spirochaetota bacterium]